VTKDAIFNPLDPGSVADPYGGYRRLRDEDPVHWHEPLRSWLLTRYRDCLAVLRDSDTFAADFRRVGIPTPAPLLSLQTLDPPEQTPLRHFAHDALHSQDLDALELDAATRARHGLAELAGRDSFDFVRDFADPFTLRTICDLVGVDPPVADATWDARNEALDRSMDAGLEPDSEEAGLRAREAFSELVDSWLAAGPTEGILGYVAANAGSTGVARDVLCNSVRAFWHAGFEVASRFMCNAVRTVLTDPGARAVLAEMADLDPAVTELARLVGPVHAVSRVSTRPAEIGGRAIARGDFVVVLLAAANRDPDEFDRPDELVLDRQPNAHLGFGKGAHSCLGFMVGKMQVRVVLAEILRAYPEMCLTGEPRPRATATLRGLESMPATLGAREAVGAAP
jgi:cytochrome P450